MTETVSSTTPMKIGFSFAKVLPPTKKKREAEKEEQERDYVTDISGNQLKSLKYVKSNGPLVIPLASQGNQKKAKPTPPSEPTPTTNEVAKMDITVIEIDQQKPKSLDELAAEEIISEAKNGLQPRMETEKLILPIILQNQIEGIDRFTDDDERFKFDVDSRPEEADEEAYENVPIEQFGEAMLRGMGWETGKPIGLNNRGLTEPVEFIARQGRLGLGATPETVEVKKKKFIKPGESREPKPIMVAPTGPDGKVRHVKKLVKN